MAAGADASPRWCAGLRLHLEQVDVADHAAPRMARAIIIAVLSGYVLNTMVSVIGSLRGLGLAGFTACLVATFALQLAHSTWNVTSWPSWFRLLTLAALAAVTFAPFAWAGPQAGATTGFLAGSTLLVFADGWRWGLYAAVAGAELLALWGTGISAADLTYGVYFTLLTGLVVYAVSSLARLIAEAHSARGELARMAVLRDRLRVAQDLHDLLGYSISAIMLKSELAYRLLPGSADQGEQELRDALGIAQRVLAEVRVVADSGLHISLAAEAAAAESTLGSAEIRLRVDLADVTRADLPEDVDVTLAIVLREALTNVLRHSKAEQCIIEGTVDACRVLLLVSNDGAQPSARPPGDGAGLTNLASRLEAIGGRLSTGTTDGWFRLTAEVPVVAGARRGYGADPGPTASGGAVVSTSAWSVAQPWHLRVVRNITAVVFTGYAALIVINVLPLSLGVWALVAFAACTAALLCTLLACSLGTPRSWPVRVQASVLGSAALLTLLPLLWIAAPWGSMGGFLAGSLLLVLTRPWRWALYGVIGACVIVFAAFTDSSIAWDAYLTISTLLTGLITFGIGSLSQLMVQVEQTRRELARAAVTQERLQVARDLHEVLGQHLSAMVLKTQQALELLSRSPCRAREEVAEVLEISRQAAATVRSVASGYRRISCHAEIESAIATLAAASIEVRTRVQPEGVPEELDTVLAVILREAITNVLRHSAARHCEIEICRRNRSVRMSVTNDGVQPGISVAIRAGSGLGDLAERLLAIGSSLTATADSGTFCLTAEIPHDAWMTDDGSESGSFGSGANSVVGSWRD